MSVARFAERLLYALAASIFVMLALEGLGVTSGKDFPTALVTVVAVASLAECVRVASDD